MAVYRRTFLWQHTGRFTFLIQKWGMKAQVNGEQDVRIWKLVMCDHYTWYMWQNDVIRDVSGVQIIYTNSNHSEIMMSVMSLFGWHQGRAETFGGAGAQSIKGAHGTRLLIGLCSLLICVSKWMLLYWYSSKCHGAGFFFFFFAPLNYSGMILLLLLLLLFLLLLLCLQGMVVLLL